MNDDLMQEGETVFDPLYGVGRRIRPGERVRDGEGVRVSNLLRNVGGQLGISDTE